MIDYDYNRKDPKSIENQALKVLNKTLREVISGDSIKKIESERNDRRKGHFGELVERYVFNKEPNNLPSPDFPEAGVELKTAAIKKVSGKNGYVAKERLVLGMINYAQVINESWGKSSFLKKNGLLLFMLYLFGKDDSTLDHRFKIIKLLDLLKNLPAEDIETLKNDWDYIVTKIRKGKAHELSEADTYYLAACTKGATAEKSMTTQPNSSTLAKSRAFSFKQKYVNFVINSLLQIAEEDNDTIVRPGSKMTVEDAVWKKLGPYQGLSVDDIAKRLSIKADKKAKGYYAMLARAMLGSKKKKILEFEKADITLKTIRLRKSGMPKESMSFPAMDYKTIINEKWDTSKLRESFATKKFLFVIFQFDDEGKLFFQGPKFWNIPYGDLENHVMKVWSETVKRIRRKRADDLPKMSFDPVCHVRPHAKNKSDKAMTAYGEWVRKQSFWLSAKYLRDQIRW